MSDEIGDTDFGVQVLISLCGHAGTAIVGFLASIFLARALGPAGYGTFYLAFAIAKFLDNPATGWAKACKKRLTETEFDPQAALGAALLFTTAFSIIAAPLAGGVISLVSEDPFLPLGVPALLFPTAVYASLKIVLSGRPNFSRTPWAQVLKTITQAVGQVVLVLVGFEIWGMVGGAVIGIVTTIPIILYWIQIRPRLPDRAVLRSITEFAKWSVPNSLLGSALGRGDIVLLGWLATASAVGLYQVALQITMPAIFLSSSIASGLTGRISNLSSRDLDWEADVQHAVSFSSIIALPLVAGAVVMGEQIVITVFSSQYTGAGGFVIGLAVYRLLTTQSGPRGSVINGLDRPRLEFLVSALKLTINLGLGVALLLTIGPIGVVIATVIAQAIDLIVKTAITQRFSETLRIFPRPLRMQTIAAALMGIEIWLLIQLIGFNGAPGIIALVGVGAVSYFAVLVVLSSAVKQTVINIVSDLHGAIQTYRNTA